MESKCKTLKVHSKLRPRYGLVIATVSTNNNGTRAHFDEKCQSVCLPPEMLDDIQWTQLCKKIAKYNWSYSWNQNFPASWTVTSTQTDNIVKPKLFFDNSSPIVDLLHNLFDQLPGKLKSILTHISQIFYKVHETFSRY